MKAADQARIRNEERLARIEREKLERAQKHAQRTAKTETAGDDAAAVEKKAAIQAAMARAKEQKDSVVPQNTKQLSPAVAAEIAAVDAARERVIQESGAKTAQSTEKAE